MMQFKLEVGPSNDAYEREADAIADAVVSGAKIDTDPLAGGQGVVQRQCSKCAEDELQMKRLPEGSTQPRGGEPLRAGDRAGSSISATLDQAQRGSGEQLPAGLRHVLEPRFQSDFGHVRVHRDPRANALSQALSARAFTVGTDIFFGRGQYRPSDTNGQRLIAHELVHTIQQTGRKCLGDRVVIQRDALNETIVPEYAQSLSDLELLEQIELVRDALGVTPEQDQGSLVWNLGILEEEALRRNQLERDQAGGGLRDERGLARVSTRPTGSNAAPIEVEIPPELRTTMGAPPVVSAGLSDSLWPGLATGGAQSLGYVLSPPIQGGLAPWTLASSRMNAQPSLAGGTVALERYAGRGSSLIDELLPRYLGPEGQQLRLIERATHSNPGQLNYLPNASDVELAGWLKSGFTTRDLEAVPALIARANSEGWAALSEAEQQLLVAVLKKHAEAGQVAGSPVISATKVAELSSKAEVAPFLHERPYVVGLEVPQTMVADANTTFREPGARLAHEGEVLIAGDARKNVTSVKPNPSSSFAKAAPYLSVGSKALMGLGIAYSAHRIATAEPEKRQRVVMEESGGHVGGYLGAGGGVTGCIVLGIASGGWGLVLCGLGGAVVGGGLGSLAGGELSDAIDSAPTEPRFPLYVCFVGDTPVTLAGGSEARIDSLKVGDLVLGWDEDSGQLTTGKVTALHCHEPTPMLELALTSGAKIKVTASHPLYSAGEWRRAGTLKVGDELATLGDGTLVSESLVAIEQQGPSGRIYTLTVDRCHNYFAGSVLAHNK